MTASTTRRPDRPLDALRPLVLERGVAPYAEGSCLVAFGDTRVLCTASVEEQVPSWRRGSGEGWLTTTRLRGATWLRAGIVNYLATEDDIDHLLATLRRLAI